MTYPGNPRDHGARGPRRRGDGGHEQPIASALEAYLHTQGHGETAVLGAIWSRWAAVVGPDVAAHASPRSLHDGTLVVAVDHPGWATQLAFLSERILQDLEEQLQRHVADRVKVTVRGRTDVE